MTAFSGFPADFFEFFKQLSKNNNRDWFNDNKSRFQASVQEPMSEFIEAMQPHLAGISKHYVADPKPHGGSMFRIYRDTRFSKDKTPYKTHAACHFRHAAGKMPTRRVFTCIWKLKTCFSAVVSGPLQRQN